MPILLTQKNPSGVAVGWSQACGHWRGAASVCPESVYVNIAQNVGVSFLAVFGGWMAAKEGGSCVGNDAYVTTISNVDSVGTKMAINVWKALADGLWSSSVAFTIYGNLNGASGPSFALTAGPIAGTSPSVQTKMVALANAGTCPTNVLGTLTVFDDGSYTLA